MINTDFQAEDRLDPFVVTKDILGFRSRTSVYEAIKTDPDFPRPVYRGRNVFFFRSETMAYLEKLRRRRDTPLQATQADLAKQASQRMLEGKAAKQARHIDERGPAE